VLEGRHSGLVGTKALGEENGACLWYGYNLCLVFYVSFCKPVYVVEGISLRACCSDEGVCKVRVGGG